VTRDLFRGLPTFVTWRRLALTSDRTKLRNALGDLHPTGGRDVPEDAGRALQAAAGVDVWPYAEHDSAAGFRDGAYRLVVLVTDAPWHKGAPLYPAMADTVRALRDRKVHLAALVNLATDQPGATFDDAATVAEATGTIARRRLDCDGDRRTDVAVGDPLVCGWRAGLKPVPSRQPAGGIRDLAAAISALVGR
jgi:hypothetical protein